MAVVNAYTNADVEAGTRTMSVFVGTGERTVTAFNNFEVAAADDDTSVYRLFKGVPTTARIQTIEIVNDAITAGTDYDLGFYHTAQADGTDGAVIDKDILVDGASMASARAITAPLIALTNLDLADLDKPIWELLGFDQFSRPHEVDLCLTANTVGTAAGTIRTKAVFVGAGA